MLEGWEVQEHNKVKGCHMFAVILAVIVPWLDWALGASTVAVKILMLRKVWWSPLFGVLIQTLWVTYAFALQEYGFLITPAVMTPIYALHVGKWRKERFEHEYVVSHKAEYIEEEHTKHPNWEYRNGSS